MVELVVMDTRRALVASNSAGLLVILAPRVEMIVSQCADKCEETHSIQMQSLQYTANCEDILLVH